MATISKNWALKMRIEYSKRFLKQYYKLTPKIQARFEERLILWRNEPDHPQLRLHELSGEYAGMYSINITGDVRALYEKVGDTYIIFGFIGTHSQLYG